MDNDSVSKRRHNDVATRPSAVYDKQRNQCHELLPNHKELLAAHEKRIQAELARLEENAKFYRGAA